MKATNPFPTLDIHHHVGSIGSILAGIDDAGPSWNAADLDSDIQTRLRYMDDHGIDQAFLMPGEYPSSNKPSGIQELNDLVAAYARRRPDRFPAVAATVDPRDVPAALEEIDRCSEVAEVRGFVWHHHFFGTFVNDPRMFPIIEHISTHGLPVFVHIIASSFLESPWRLEHLASEFPETTFVALDGFSTPDQALWMPFIAEKYPNITFDTGVATTVAHMLPAFIDRVGSDRLCFGSDFYSHPRLFQIPYVIYELLNSELDGADLRRTFGGTARRLLGLAGADGA